MKSDQIAALIISLKKAPDIAKKYLESQGIKVTWDWEEALDSIKKHCFTVSKITNADVLQTIHDELEKAMKEGKPYAEFKKELEPLLQDKGYVRKDDGSAWRLDTIYRTNLQSAYMTGRYHEQLEVVDEFPYWEYVSVLDNRTTDGCESLNNTCLPSNDQFWNGNYPPRHHNCRSRVVSRNDKTLKRDGKKLSNPAKYKDIKAAKGFDTKPGEWKPDLSKYNSEMKKQLKKVIA